MEINGFFSQWFSVDSGIPQGSILVGAKPVLNGITHAFELYW